MTTNRKLRAAMSVAWRACTDVYGQSPKEREAHAALQYVGSSPPKSRPGEWQLRHAQRMVDIIEHETKAAIHELRAASKANRAPDFDVDAIEPLNAALEDLIDVMRRCRTVDRICE